MTTYSFIDESGETRLVGTISPAPGGSQALDGTTALTPTATGKAPYNVAVTPDGATVYVADAGEDTPGLVTPIDVATNIAGTPIEVGDFTYALAITPDGATCYAGGNDIRPIDVATGAVGAAIGALFTDAMAITPNGATVYVVDDSTPGHVTPITVATNIAGTPFVVGDGPNGIAITPDGTKGYSTNSDGTVTPFSIPANVPGTPITVGNGPYGIVVTPDNATAFVGNTSDGTITPIDVATNTPGAPITIPQGVSPGLALTPDGTTLYVTNSADKVTPVDVATLVVGSPITISSGGKTPGGIAITPDGTTAYVSLSGAAQAGTVVTIDVATNASPAIRPVALSALSVGTLKIIAGALDPKTVTMTPAPLLGSQYLRETGETWIRTGTGLTDWAQVATV